VGGVGSSEVERWAMMAWQALCCIVSVLWLACYSLTDTLISHCAFTVYFYHVACSGLLRRWGHQLARLARRIHTDCASG
jgi:hypothetical protein